LGIYLGSQYVGSILYEDDIALLFGTCRGLQIMLDICADFGREWDICFNASKTSCWPQVGTTCLSSAFW